jgi:serine/threonine protein kinase
MSKKINKYIYSTKEIGKGAFSKVYKGFNIETDEIIAIKIIDKTSLKHNLIDRLYGEIELLTQLSHENIAKLKEFFQSDENFYLILEYCAGGDLSHRIKSGDISEDIACKYMKQLANALFYLKNRNIIHRDLKPQNILLTVDLQTIKITDFNFARELYENDLAQTMCGSPLYMAPEIISGGTYTVKSDLWSVGLILYEMVYGKSPYSDAVNIMDLLKKINTKNIKYSNSVSFECNDLLRRLLQKKPKDRCNWDDFFTHGWLCNEEPEYIKSDQKDVWESISAISEPINVRSPNLQSRVVDNYVPFGVSPPQNTKSEPIDIFKHRRRTSSTSRDNSIIYPSSAPERAMSDYFWSYMRSSVDILKGAADYIASTTKK